MTTYITKTQPAYTQHYPNTIVLDGNVQHGRWSYDVTNSLGRNTIEYEEGPQYIRVDGKKMCNWKNCHHSRGFSAKGVTAHYSQYGVWPSQGYEYYTDWYDCPVYKYSSFGLASFSGTIPSSSVVDELMSEVYTDIAGRANEFLLSLEDLAGLFSGRTLFESIRGVAGAINGVGKAISQCRNLARVFSWKDAIYSMWLSSKEAVRQAVGFRLGYRFSFKTTLNDICKAVDFGTQFGSFSKELLKRNQADFLRYSKKSTISGNPIITQYTGSSFGSRFLSSSPNSAAKRYFYNPTGDVNGEIARQAPPATVLKRGGRSAVAFAKARVRYPTDYLTMRHYFESRFGLDKPLTTLWAIVPLSFLVDYLLNVQDALTYVDNKLTDYLVATSIGSAWVCDTTFRESVLDIPQATMHFHYGGDPERLHQINWPHVHTVVRESSDFSRSPVASSAIRAQLPSLISADDNNWVRSVGTGLELLSQTRLR